MQKNNKFNSIKGFLFAILLCFVASRIKNRFLPQLFELKDQTDTPVIGIFAQPSSQKVYYQKKDYQYVLNTNINWIQMSGAQTVIIPFDETEEYYDNIFSKINGILFTGGNLNINKDLPVDKYQPGTGYNQWTQNAAYLIQKAIKANDEGDFFPVWGNCQGFQLLHYIISGYNNTILNYITNDFNYTRNIQFSNIENSNVLKLFSTEQIDYSQSHTPFLYLHELGVTEKDYQYNPKLKDFFKIIGVSANSTDFSDPNAFKYLAIAEAKKYPFAGVQFHPEYTIFQPGFNSNRSFQSFDIASYFSRYFISLARKNSHKFSSNEERNEYLSFNYPSVHIKGYLFDKVTFIPRKQYDL